KRPFRGIHCDVCFTSKISSRILVFELVIWCSGLKIERILQHDDGQIQNARVLNFGSKTRAREAAPRALSRSPPPASAPANTICETLNSGLDCTASRAASAAF